MNAPELIGTLLDYARAASDGGAPPLPADLAGRSFSWTGGGIGPPPPVDAHAGS